MGSPVSRLEGIPGDPSLIDRSAIAERLLALLPRAPATPDSPGDFLKQLDAGIKRTGSSELSLVLIYVILMSVGGWVFASSMEPAVSTQTAQQVLVR
jgi:hypothetical protein